MDIPYLLLKSNGYETRKVPESHLTSHFGALTNTYGGVQAHCQQWMVGAACMLTHLTQ